MIITIKDMTKGKELAYWYNDNTDFTSVADRGRKLQILAEKIGEAITAGRAEGASDYPVMAEELLESVHEMPEVIKDKDVEDPVRMSRKMYRALSGEVQKAIDAGKRVRELEADNKILQERTADYPVISARCKELEQAKELLREVLEEKKVADEITGTFWEALKKLKLEEMYVHTPGRHFTERIEQLGSEIENGKFLYGNACKEVDALSTYVKKLEAEIEGYKKTQLTPKGVDHLQRSASDDRVKLEEILLKYKDHLERCKEQTEDRMKERDALVRENEGYSKLIDELRNEATADSYQIKALKQEIERLGTGDQIKREKEIAINNDIEKELQSKLYGVKQDILFFRDKLQKVEGEASYYKGLYEGMDKLFKGALGMVTELQTRLIKAEEAT